MLKTFEQIEKFHDENLDENKVFHLPEALVRWSRFVEVMCKAAKLVVFNAKVDAILDVIIAACNIAHEEEPVKE